jgi:repressor LexA
MELTPRQRSVYDFLISHHHRYGFSPTVREICQQLGLAGPAGVHRILGVLEEKGYIRSTAGKKRSWRPVNPGNIHKMPVLGRIAAGDPMGILDRPEEHIPVDPGFFGQEQCFALNVSGDSMIGAHIQDGDLAIISPQPDVGNGRIAAVIVEGILPEATLKIVRKKRNVLELHSANPAYPIMQFPQRHRRKVRIIGKYVGLVRKVF